MYGWRVIGCVGTDAGCGCEVTGNWVREWVLFGFPVIGIAPAMVGSGGRDTGTETSSNSRSNLSPRTVL